MPIPDALTGRRNENRATNDPGLQQALARLQQYQLPAIRVFIVIVRLRRVLVIVVDHELLTVT